MDCAHALARGSEWSGCPGMPLSETIPRLGGSCVDYGCTPNKTMIATAGPAHAVRRVEGFGVEGCGRDPAVEMGQIRSRKRKVVSSFRSELEEMVESPENIELIRGTGSFESPHVIKIAQNSSDGRRSAFGKIFINTGT